MPICVCGDSVFVCMYVNMVGFGGCVCEVCGTRRIREEMRRKGD